MTDLLQLLIFGTVLGSIYALGAVGVSLAFGILRFANFAHGAMMTLGAYFALILVRDIGIPKPLSLPLGQLGGVGLGLDIPVLFLAILLTMSAAGIALTLGYRFRQQLAGRVVIAFVGLAVAYALLSWARDAKLVDGSGSAHLAMVPAFIVAVIAMGGMAVAIDQVLYRRLRRTAPVILLISSFGVALIVRSAVQVIWGPDSVVYDPSIQIAWQWGGLRIKPDHLTILVVTVLLVALLYLFLQKTRLGTAMRAMSDDPDLASVTGIDTEQVIIYTWFISGGLAAAAGIFLAMDTRLIPLMGFNALLPIFAAALVGGIGRPYGAIAGGFLVGIATETSTMIIPAVYKPAVAFFFVVVILIVRPRGLFKGQ
ncbi:MAG: branched-chain amino acid ABC transporter permease [Alphaproteobacteria bacterium]|nr:branched-chain amino acid ABC transporter permease [Alphaproteobacteria bacterium]